MVSDIPGRGARPAAFNPITLHIALRAIFIGVLACVVLMLLLNSRLYATALVVVLVMAVVIMDLVAVIGRLDREVERFLLAFTAGAVEAPLQRRALLTRTTAIYEDAATHLTTQRSLVRRRLEHLQAQLDNVAASLFVLQPDGSAVPTNRAAQRLAGETVGRLRDLPALGPAAMALSAMAPGAQRIVKLADGTQMLALCAQFTVPGEAPARLLSLQRVTGDLDAVQMQAWADVTRVLAHEMMNSLTPIASLAESLGKLLPQSASADATGALEAIQRRSRGLMSFVERYRKVAELPEPSVQPISLADLLGSIETLMKPGFTALGIDYHRELRPESLRVSADPQLLEQALINLLRNAMDAATAAPQPRIELAAGQHDGIVEIRIADNGHGLDEATREHLFVPFFTTKPGGSGVGLSLARHIALAHGGRLEVATTQPTGATFTLLLPGQDTAGSIE